MEEEGITEMNIWRDLSPDEVKEFVKWTLENWRPDRQINGTWHPVVRNTWMKLDEAFDQAKRQIMADYRLVQ